MTISTSANSFVDPSENLIEIFEECEGEVEYESQGKVYMTFPTLESYETFKSAAELEGISCNLESD